MKTSNKLISLVTYRYNNVSVGINKESKIVKINKEWLLKEIAPLELDEFMESYTWDESDYLYKKYRQK